jgi:hypothetical protein
MPPQPLDFLPLQSSPLHITAAFTLLLCAFYIVYICYLSPLAHIASPLGLSLSRLWMIKHAWEGDTHRQMIALHERYVKVVRTGPNEVSVSKLSAIKKIYGPYSSYL